MTLQLKYEDVKEAAKKAYLEGRLGAQTHAGFPDTGKGCFYRYRDGSCCAVGAVLDDATAEKFDSLDSSAVRALAEKRFLLCDNLRALSALQNLHDDWATAVPAEKPELQARFAAMIGVPA